MEKTPPKQWKITVHSLGPCTLLHMTPKLFLGRESNTDVLCLENPTLYLLMKISNASAPSETLQFPLQKPSPFSLCLQCLDYGRKVITCRAKVGYIIYVGIIPSLPWLLTFPILQAWMQQHICEFLVQKWSKILLSQI